MTEQHPCPIPPIKAPAWKGTWDQPDPRNFRYGPGVAYLYATELAQLSTYDYSIPSGVYPGKMWRRRTPEDDGWLLCWFEEVPGDPDKCQVGVLKVVPHEMLDLISK